MASAGNVLNQSNASIGHAGTNKKNASSRAMLMWTRPMTLIIAVGLAGILIVLTGAYCANLNRVNNELQKDNQYIEAEIDSLSTQIGNATNIAKVESVASTELGMVHPDSQNCVTVGDSKGEETNLAATIKQEAYE